MKYQIKKGSASHQMRSSVCCLFSLISSQETNWSFNCAVRSSFHFRHRAVTSLPHVVDKSTGDVESCVPLAPGPHSFVINPQELCDIFTVTDRELQSEKLRKLCSGVSELAEHLGVSLAVGITDQELASGAVDRKNR